MPRSAAQWLTIGKLYFYYTPHPRRPARHGQPTGHRAVDPYAGPLLEGRRVCDGAKVRVQIRPGSLVLTVEDG